jgi:plasmid stabilization system protein ParE
MAADVLSPEALQDLQSIWDFIAADDVNAADKFQDDLFNAFDRLAE